MRDTLARVSPPHVHHRDYHTRIYTRTKHIHTHFPHGEMYIYIDLCILSRPPPSPLFHPRRSVELKRITETTHGDGGRSEGRIHPLPSSDSRPPATYLSRSHSSILSSALASSAASYPLPLPPSGNANQSYVRNDIRTITMHERERALATSLLLVIIHLLRYNPFADANHA